MLGFRKGDLYLVPECRTHAHNLMFITLAEGIGAVRLETDLARVGIEHVSYSVTTITYRRELQLCENIPLHYVNSNCTHSVWTLYINP